MNYKHTILLLVVFLVACDLAASSLGRNKKRGRNRRQEAGEGGDAPPVDAEGGAAGENVTDAEQAGTGGEPDETHEGNGETNEGAAESGATQSEGAGGKPDDKPPVVPPTPAPDTNGTDAGKDKKDEDGEDKVDDSKESKNNTTKADDKKGKKQGDKAAGNITLPEIPSLGSSANLIPSLLLLVASGFLVGQFF